MAQAAIETDMVREIVANYHPEEIDTSSVVVPDYASLKKPLVEVFTLDSAQCAACSYMMNAATHAVETFGDAVDLVEYKFIYKENVARCVKMGVKNLPSLYINGELNIAPLFRQELRSNRISVMRLNSAENKTQEGNGIRLYLITRLFRCRKNNVHQAVSSFVSFGERVELIVNEFGKEGVDGALLSELGAVMKEINGGSIFCACRMDQFEKALQQSIARQPDIILVEASGMSDPTGVRRLFAQTDRFAQISYQGAVCLVDAVRFPKLYATARTCVRQLSSSDIAIINRTDLASSDQIQQTESLIRGQRPDIRMIKTTFGKISPEFLRIFHRRYRMIRQ